MPFIDQKKYGKLAYLAHKNSLVKGDLLPEWESLNDHLQAAWVNVAIKVIVESHREEWQPIASAPKNERVLVLSESGEIYAAHWVQSPVTGDEAWLVAEWGDEGDQALIKPTHWMKAPAKLKTEPKTTQVEIEGVYCDSCGKDYSNSDEQGGMVFAGGGRCPSCTARLIPDIEKYNEQDAITAKADPGESFRDFSLRMRNGNNTATITTLN